MNKTLKEQSINTNGIELNWRHIKGYINEVHKHIGIKRDITRQEYQNMSKKQMEKVDNNK